MILKKERQGEFYILLQGVLWSLWPVITVLSYSSLSPLFSLAWSTLFAVPFFAGILSIKKKWYETKNFQALKDILGATIFIGIGYYAFFFLGLKYTSPGNAMIIALIETLFSYLFFHTWRKEYIPSTHIIGAILMLCGAAIVFYPNTTSWNKGDFFILIASVLAPFGNYFQRRARMQVSSETIMFVRSAVSTPVIFILGLLFQGQSFSFDIRTPLLFLLINGFLFMGLSKIFWIEGIHRVSVTKANALSTIAPFLTLIFAWLFLNNLPTLWQISSLLPMTVGLVLLGINKQQKL